MTRLDNASEIRELAAVLVIAEAIAANGDDERREPARLRADKYRTQLRALLECA